MATLSGTVNRERVVLVHMDDHIPVFDIEPDENGDWSAQVPAGEPFLAIYLSETCQPEIHGPYWGA